MGVSHTLKRSERTGTEPDSQFSLRLTLVHLSPVELSASYEDVAVFIIS
jgi:hypothetical protein